MRVFKTRVFTKFANYEDIPDNDLINAIETAEKGLIDAELGGNLIKLRIARKGQGKSSGYRTLIAYKKNKIAVFLHGFAKNERANISKDELASLKEMASAWVKVEEKKIANALSTGLLQEVSYE